MDLKNLDGWPACYSSMSSKKQLDCWNDQLDCLDELSWIFKFNCNKLPVASCPSVQALYWYSACYCTASSRRNDTDLVWNWDGVSWHDTCSSSCWGSLLPWPCHTMLLDETGRSTFNPFGLSMFFTNCMSHFGIFNWFQSFHTRNLGWVLH